jgi:cell division protein FtsW
VRALLKRFFQGNTILWMLFLALMVFSFLPVFSGSRNGLVGHFGFVALGLLMAFLVHRLPSKYFGALALLGLALVVPLLAYTLMTGGTIAGANAARWFRIGGLSFQPSALANIVLIAHLSRVLTRKNAPKSLKEGGWNVILPLVLICGLVVPANLSTALLIFMNASVVMWTAGFPRKAYGQLVGIFALFLLVFVKLDKVRNGYRRQQIPKWLSYCYAGAYAECPARLNVGGFVAGAPEAAG